MKIEICPVCEGTGEIRHDVGTHNSDYVYETCHKCNGSGKIIKTTILYTPTLPYSPENRTLLYTIDNEVHAAIREIYKKYNLKY